MAEPYWQITTDTASYKNMERIIGTCERAMAKLYEAMENLEDGQTLTLYHVDADGLVHPEYKITRQ